MSSDARKKPQYHFDTLIQGLFNSGKELEIMHNSEYAGVLELKICDVDDSERSIQIDIFDFFRMAEKLKNIMDIKTL